MAKYHLDPKTISAVIEGYKAGMTYKSIMLQYHVNKNQIYYCVKKRCPEVLEGRVTLRKETKARFYQNTIYPLIDDFKAGAAVGTLAAHYHLTKHQVYCYLSSLCPQEYQAWLAAQKQEKQKRLDLLTLQKEVQKEAKKAARSRFYQNTIYPLIEGYKAGARLCSLASQYHLTHNQVYYYVKMLCPKEHSARVEAKIQERQRRLNRLASGHDRPLPVP